MDFQSVKWLDPWVPTEAGLEKELSRELAPGHPLYGVKAVSVARRGNNDDVLFKLENARAPLAIVHLTWSGKQEESPFPWAVFYDSLENWAERVMKPDHRGEL